MKLATVRCDVKRGSIHRTPRNNTYHFKPNQSLDVSSLDDLRYFERRTEYDVSPTVRGKFYAKLVGENESPEDVLSDMGYRAKQSLAKSLGIKANQSDEELTQELEKEVDALKKQMEEL